MGVNKHLDSGFSCLLGHVDEPQCVKCAKCGKFIRPSDMNEECPEVEILDEYREYFKEVD